jgi:hypothetical protein
MISTSLSRPLPARGNDPGAIVEARIDTKRIDARRVNHTLTLVATREGSALWEKVITYEVDTPFDVPDLDNVDPFVIASIFPALSVGGTLRVHGAVSRTLIRNIMDYQSAWCLVAPDHCFPFALEVAEVDDGAQRDPGPHPNSILAFTGGLDSMLALCRNVSGDAGPTGHDIGATMTILAPGFGQGTTEDSAEMIARIRHTSGRWNLPLAVVRTNIAKEVGMKSISHGSWLASCLMLFSGRFDVGLVGSSIPSYSAGYEIYGSHPRIDPLMSAGRMSIRNDEGRYTRTEKIALLTRYPEALEELTVCFHPYRHEGNCCRCEKCVRTMLAFVAVGSEVPPAFPEGLRLDSIGIGMGKPLGLHKAGHVIAYARKNGMADHEAIQTAWRRYRVKRVKVRTKQWISRLYKRQQNPRWKVVEEL